MSSSGLVITFSEFAFGGLTKNPASTSKNGIIKILKFLLVRPPADANLVLGAVYYYTETIVMSLKTMSIRRPP